MIIWLAENISTFFGVWRYPNQIGAWATVNLGKWSSWSMMVIMTFTIVANSTLSRTGAGSTNVYPKLVNSGNIVVNGGTLYMNANVTNSNAFTVSNGEIQGKRCRMISRSTRHLSGSSISHHPLSSVFCKSMRDEGTASFVPHAIVVFSNLTAEDGVEGGNGLRITTPSPTELTPRSWGRACGGRPRSGGASSERGMTASSPWIWTRGTSGCRSSRPCSLRWNRVMAILLFGYGGG